jgi:PPP family 3-phenylpropionic acid transporter
VRFGWIRLHYLLVYAIVGAYMPYLPVFLGEDLGMPDWQIGWATGAYGLSVLLAPPVITALADRRVPGRTLIGGAYALAALALAGLALADEFFAVLALVLAFSMTYTPLFSLVDGLTFSAIAAAGERAPPYDRIRLWGSVGFMLPAFVLLLVLHAGAGGRAAIATAAVFAAVAALASPGLPRLAPEPRVAGDRGAAWTVLRAPQTRALLLPLALLFASISTFYAFYGRLVIAVGIDPAWVGMVMNLGVLAELPFMLAAGALLRRFSLRTLLLAGAAALAVRMVLLALAHPVLTVASQVLHGPAVVALYLLPPMYLNFRAPPGLRNSVQGLYAMVCFGVARLLGSVAGGYAAEVDLAWAFALGAALAAAAFVWLAAAFHDPEADKALRMGRDGGAAPVVGGSSAAVVGDGGSDVEDVELPPDVDGAPASEPAQPTTSAVMHAREDE